MKQSPILFSTDMVQAILEGRKTQTRRVITPHNVTNMAQRKSQFDFSDIHPNGTLGVKVGHKSNDTLWRGMSRWGAIGDLMWVKETFSIEYPPFDQPKFLYRTEHHKWEAIWKPSIHMPKDAARIWLRITDIRAERLNEISEEDALAEGGHTSQQYYPEKGPLIPAVDSFKSLWDSINAKKHPWSSNPWVWAITFERIDNPNNQSV